MNTLKNIKDTVHLKDKHVLLRVDFNVSVADKKVQNDYRIRRTLPTITFLQKQGAKIIIMSHFKGKETMSLKVVSDYCQNLFSHTFISDILSNETKTYIKEMQAGEIILLENLRLHPEEEANDEGFAKQLALYGEVYVNEAFSASHRKHASIVGVPKYVKEKYAGMLFCEEVSQLKEAFTPSHPFLFILGGAKFETKMPLVQKFLERSDDIFIGGALANDLFKSQGKEVGESLLSKEKIELRIIANNSIVFLPSDVVIQQQDNSKKTVLSDNVDVTDTIMDAGVKTIAKLKKKIASAQFVLWNGPLGNYELGYTEATVSLASLLGKAKAKTIVGGGDTLTAIESLNNYDDFTFVSTGGGAMLDYLAHETLPGIEALEM